MKRRSRTVDRSPSLVLTIEQLGPKRHRTPEGYLFCEDVPAARVGDMVYAAGEIPLEALNGQIVVTRGEDELFTEATLASYNGKPVVDYHPDKFNLSSDNYREMARHVVGVTLNPRRGEGDDKDVMLVDLIIMDAASIRDVEAGKVEVSAGYEADYEQTGPGAGRQRNIIGNHIALVERGRCGPRCAIGDHQPKGAFHMPSLTKRRAALQTDAVRRVFKDAEDALMGVIGDAPGDAGSGDDNGDDNHIHVHVHGSGEAGEPAAAAAGAAGVETKDDPIEARFQAIESTLAELLAVLNGKKEAAAADAAAVSEKDGPANSDGLAGADDDITSKDALPEELEALKGAKTGDSMALQTAFSAVLSDAEVLVPGFRLPTFDAKSTRRVTLDSMCGLRRDVLRHLNATSEGGQLLAALGGGQPLNIDKAPCVSVATTFRSAAGTRRLINNTAATGDAGRVPDLGNTQSAAPMTLRQLNELHHKFHQPSAH